jgi:hypothetical protein
VLVPGERTTTQPVAANAAVANASVVTNTLVSYVDEARRDGARFS